MFLPLAFSASYHLTETARDAGTLAIIYRKTFQTWQV